VNVEKIFDMFAKNYEKIERRFDSLQSRSVENTKKYLKGAETVLDFGCGTGKVAVELAGHVKKLEGIDISSKMIELACSKARKLKIENVNFKQATVFDEKYSEESFDVILSFSILHLLEDPRKAVNRMYDLLKPEGLLISVTPSLGEPMAVKTRLQFFFFQALMRVGLFPRVIRFQFQELDDLMTGGGFQIIETEKMYHEMSSYYIAARKI
jgi:ubiquinone/menaquinone biosynthesis C-methylase UbiE